MPDEWFAYLRKSKGIAGIARQRASTTDHLAGRGGTVAREFAEADSTAYRDPLAPLPPRPRFDAMLAEMAARPGVGIAAWHADRLGRDPETTEILIRACMRGGHLITTVRGGDYDVSTANGRHQLRADINSAAHEVDHNTERVIEAKAEAAGEGRWLGGKRPFGWQPAGDGVLVLDEPEAALIRRGCDAVVEGTAVRALVREWNDSGVTGALGGRWTASTVRKALLRARNAGLVEHRGQLVDLGKDDGGRDRAPQWPAIVTEETWRTVRAVLTDPARRTNSATSAAHLLTGIALCGGCGVPVMAQGGAHRYCCSRRTRQMPARPGPHASRSIADVDAYIAVLATGRVKRDDAAHLLRADRRAERKALAARREGLESRKAEQWRLYRADVITDMELGEGRREIRAELAEVDAQLTALERADALAPFLADPERAWDDAPLERRRGLVAALMYVTILPGAHRGRRAGFRIGERHFDPELIDVRWARRLPSDG